MPPPAPPSSSTSGAGPGDLPSAPPWRRTPGRDRAPRPGDGVRRAPARCGPAPPAAGSCSRARPGASLRSRRAAAPTAPDTTAPGRLEAGVEVNRPEQGLEGIGQDRRLAPAAGLLLARAEAARASPTPSAEAMLARGWSWLTTEIRTLVISPSLRVGGGVEVGGDDELQHRVAQELEALVGAVGSRWAAMGEGPPQQVPVGRRCGRGRAPAAAESSATASPASMRSTRPRSAPSAARRRALATPRARGDEPWATTTVPRVPSRWAPPWASGSKRSRSPIIAGQHRRQGGLQGRVVLAEGGQHQAPHRRGHALGHLEQHVAGEAVGDEDIGRAPPQVAPLHVADEVQRGGGQQGVGLLLQGAALALLLTDVEQAHRRAPTPR